MSDISLVIVSQKKQTKLRYDMAKIVIQSENIAPFGGYFFNNGLI